MDGITKEQREKFLADYQSRIVEVAGYTPEEAKLVAEAIESVDDLIEEGFDGVSAADEEMSYWDNDGED